MSGDIEEAAIAIIRARARSGTTNGRDLHPIEAAYLERCTHFHWRTGTIVMFTRDRGHHTGGWFKNPDYERCRHLSLSFRAPSPARAAHELGSPHRIARLGGLIQPRAFDSSLAAEWVKLLHGDDRRYAWEEGAFSTQGRELAVRHYRVWCDQGWQAIKPRGEVYSRELTEAGWRSWSEVQGEDAPKNWVDAE